MTVEEFLATVVRRNEQRPGIHTLWPGATEGDILRWELAHGCRLPEELACFLRKTNGLGLHQEWYDGEPIYQYGAYYVYPLQEIDRADVAMYGKRDLSGRVKDWVAFGEGPDASVYFVFHCKSLHYLIVEPIVPDEAQDVGDRLDAILNELLPAALD